MRIIKATDPMPVDHPVFCIIGDPGIGKTTLLFTAEAPLCLDFDKGTYRAQNRKDTLEIASWADVRALLESKGELEPYQTIGLDTTGRCLDMLVLDIQAGPDGAKYVRDGTPTQQGWGKLKTRFRGFINELRSLGKDVVLLNHAKEDKDGDVRTVRADIQGGSYAEVMKVADFIGYMTMAGKERILDFNPTERSIGKNPAGWPAIPVPHFTKSPRFLGELIAKGKGTLGKIGEESSKAAMEVADWMIGVEAMNTAEELQQALPKVKALSPIVGAQVKSLLWQRAKALGIHFDKAKETFVAPVAAAV